jgi:ribosomal protein S27AE
MQTTITEFHNRPCSRCGGARFISQFMHRNGGECFRCGTTGFDPQMVAVTREMTDEEVLTALETAGFPVVFTDHPLEFNTVEDLFLSDAQVAARVEVMAGARAFLAALPA